MQVMQPIRAKTKSGINILINIIEEGTKFSVLMSNISFPPGTLFESAEDALKKSICAQNSCHINDDIESLDSSSVEEFITNENETIDFFAIITLESTNPSEISQADEIIKNSLLE